MREALDVEALPCRDLCACSSGDGPGWGAISMVWRLLMPKLPLLLMLLLVLLLVLLLLVEGV